MNKRRNYKKLMVFFIGFFFLIGCFNFLPVKNVEARGFKIHSSFAHSIKSSIGRENEKSEYNTMEYSMDNAFENQLVRKGSSSSSSSSSSRSGSYGKSSSYGSTSKFSKPKSSGSSSGDFSEKKKSQGNSNYSTTDKFNNSSSGNKFNSIDGNKYKNDSKSGSSQGNSNYSTTDKFNKKAPSDSSSSNKSKGEESNSVNSNNKGSSSGYYGNSNRGGSSFYEMFMLSHMIRSIGNLTSFMFIRRPFIGIGTIIAIALLVIWLTRRKRR